MKIKQHTHEREKEWKEEEEEEGMAEKRICAHKIVRAGKAS